MGVKAYAKKSPTKHTGTEEKMTIARPPKLYNKSSPKMLVIHDESYVLKNLNLERPMVRNSFDTDVFKWFLTLIVDHGYERWYRLIHYVSDEGKATGVRDIIAIISNHTKFHNLPESPTDIFIFSLRKSDLSLEYLSFKAILKPFELEVWFMLVLTAQTMVAVLVVIFIIKLEWNCLESISLAQLVVISMMFEKPTEIKTKISKILEYKILFGFWMLLLQILTNSYIGLSVTSISAPLESKSVTRYEQLTKPGCQWNDMKCHMNRIKEFRQYINYWERADVNDEAYWVDFYANLGMTFTFDRNRTLEALRNKSIRRFDINRDFVLLPYSIEENISKEKLTDNDFYYRLESYLTDMVSKFLTKFELGETLISSREPLKLFDLLDPWHIPHPVIGNLSDMKSIKYEWDTEHTIVQCGRTVLVLHENEIKSEMRYFEKHYPWLKFFESKSKLLTAELGWKFSIQGPSLSVKIFNKLYVAGIIQLLETWPRIASPKRLNITTKVHTLVERRKPEDAVKKIMLGGNIQTIFWLYIFRALGGVIDRNTYLGS
ncbi:hypothetical protein Fcan01_15869 [Folsomia candida]|uniref:Uncharacterized protein n=1 Tax=Folsomia candida TaxID=158441 RepID=A0A226DX69_FOLCA|nr:hypothetical protein Fcan01_15869 [Folsomia candida]